MRTNIPHLNVSDLDWETLGSHGLRRKLLSGDEETKAGTQYVDIPKGWQGGGVAHFHDASEEVYVIHGDVTLNGRDYLGDGSYIYRPAGIVHGHDEGAKKGCHCIIKTGGMLELKLIHDPADPEEYVLHPSGDGRPFILDLRTNDMAWSTERLGSGDVGWKILNMDRRSGDYTAMLSMPSGWTGSLDLDPGAGWEWFVVEGGLELADGTAFSEGGYSYRAVGAPPATISGTEEGATVLHWRDG